MVRRATRREKAKGDECSLLKCIRPDSDQASDQEDDCQSLSGFSLRVLQRNDAACGTKIAEEVVQG